MPIRPELRPLYPPDWRGVMQKLAQIRSLAGKPASPVARFSHTLLSQARAVLTHRASVHAGFRQIVRKKCWVGTVFLAKVDAVFKGSKADVSLVKLAFACPSSISAVSPLRAVSNIGGILIYLRRARDLWRLRERNN
jgi:hypothetical protein